MLTVDITSGEIQSGIMNSVHLAAAVKAVREEGLVALADVVNTDHLNNLRSAMLADVEHILARPDAPYNWNPGNVQQQPPPAPPYLFRDVLVNDMVIAVTRAVLGEQVFNSFYSGNTAIPGTHRQPVHFDTGQPDNGGAPAPAFALVVNIPVVQMSPLNGSTEIWPGTHLITGIESSGGEITIPEDILEDRRGTAPPIQPTLALGSVLIRDMRLWHAGMPNLTDTPRPMIAMIHGAEWWVDPQPLVVPVGCEEYFRHPELTWRVQFANRLPDHLQHGEAYG